MASSAEQNKVNSDLLKQSNLNILKMIENMSSFFASKTNVVTNTIDTVNVNNRNSQPTIEIDPDDGILYSLEEAEEHEQYRIAKANNEKTVEDIFANIKDCNQFEPCGLCNECLRKSKLIQNLNIANNSTVTYDKLEKELKIRDDKICQLRVTIDLLNDKLTFLLNANKPSSSQSHLNEQFPVLPVVNTPKEQPWNIVQNKNKKYSKIIEMTSLIGSPSINTALVKISRPNKPPFNLMPDNIITKEKQLKAPIPKNTSKMEWMNTYIDEETYEKRVQDVMKKASLHIAFNLANGKLIDKVANKIKEDQKCTIEKAKQMTIRNTVNSFLKNDLKISAEAQKEI